MGVITQLPPGIPHRTTDNEITPLQSYIEIVKQIYKEFALLLITRSEVSRQKTDRLARTCEQSTAETASSQRRTGDAKGWEAAASLTLLALSIFRIPYIKDDDRKFFDFGSRELAPKLGDMYSSTLYAEQTRSQGKGSLALQRLQLESTREQEASTASGNNNSVLQAALQAQTAASRAG